MQSTADEGVDFRPFFDMTVGILFILLILIGALLFFQQSSSEEAAARESERNARVIQAEITTFLEIMASDLRQHGLEPTVDVANKSLSLPLASFAKIGPGGFPDISDQRAGEFGRTLASRLQCLTPEPERTDLCAAYEHLRLGEVAVHVETGNLAAGAALRQDRFARLLTSEFSTALLRTAPELLTLADAAGRAVINSAGSLSSAPPAQGESVGGDLLIGFEFAPP